MPTDETRRLLRTFGVAVTNYEDAVTNGGRPEDVKEAEAEVRSTLEQIQALIEKLKASVK
jgi:hypothetical protein